MALFRRNKQQSSVLPDEVNQYYKSQKRERTGVAFMLGILALVATLLVGLGVFFGGRYVYQKIRGNDTPNNTTVQTNPGPAKDTKTEAEKKAEPNDAKVGDQQVAPTPAPPTPAPQTTPAPAPAPVQTPTLGDEPTTLPATGDEGH